MTELVEYTPPAGGRLVEWATAADAAWTLANRLVWTELVPQQFRVTTDMTPARQQQIAGNAAAALLWGEELHLPPFSALRSIYVVRGTPAMYAKAVVGLALSAGHRIWTETEADDTVTVCGHRQGDPDRVERVTYTFARAQAEGLTRNDQYRIRPRAMLWARAASIVASRVAADILTGIPEALADDLVESDARPVSAGPVQRRTPVREVPPPPTPPGQGPGGTEAPAASGETVGPVSDATPEPDISDPSVIPQSEPEAPVDLMSPAQSRQMFAMFNKVGVTDRDHRLRYTVDVIGRDITTSRELTRAEASEVINALVRDDEGGES